MRVGSSKYSTLLFHGPTATEEPETEEMFECLLLKNWNNVAKLMPVIKLVWPKGFG